MKVLHVIPSLGVGGAERMALSVIQALPVEVDSRLVTLLATSGTHLEEEARAQALDWRPLGKGLGFSWEAVQKLDREIADFRPDAIHTHLYACFYTLLTQSRLRVRSHVHTLHTLADKEQPLLGRLALRVLGRRVKVTPIARAVEESAWREGYRRVQAIIPNGILLKDNAYVDPPRSAGGPTLLAVGRLVAVKNHQLLLRAFAIALPKLPSARLLLAGDGPLRADLESLANELGINESVQFLGLVSDMSSLYAISDLLVMSSDYEGHPMSVMEAMAQGLPVAATRVGGLPDLVDEGVTGMLTLPGDAEALAGAIIRLLDRDCLLRCSSAAFERARTEFSAQTMTERYMKLYKEN